MSKLKIMKNALFFDEGKKLGGRYTSHYNRNFIEGFGVKFFLNCIFVIKKNRVYNVEFFTHISIEKSFFI
jgi:hypothetical protein